MARASSNTHPSADAVIEALGLAGVAKDAAYDLKRRHPDIVFTSGRRDTVAQARAMAASVVRNRQWIVETYVFSSVSFACQKWVDDHPEAVTHIQIQNGLQGVLDSLPNKQVVKLSKHLSGEAFHLQPVLDQEKAAAIKTSIWQLAGLTKFVEKRGDLVVWHAQF